MSSRKNRLRLRVQFVGVATALLVAAPASATIPSPDPVGRVPLVGLLPRWTWDLSARSAPTTAPAAEDGAVATARQFIERLVARQGEMARDVVAYRLDDPQLVAVVVHVERPDGEASRMVPVAFTVRVTRTVDGRDEASLVLEDR